MGEETQFKERSEIEEILDSIDQRFKSFKNFDFDSNPPSDHYFLNPQTFKGGFLYSSSRRLNDEILQKKRIEQELDMLRDNLPKSIYVRVYESRRDLMRAVIVVLTGPNAYALFFFDIFFPKDYPSKPPQIYHHHHRNLLNSNPSSITYGINKNGGLDFRWDPRTSTIYEVFECIQRYDLRFSKIYARVEEKEKDYLILHNAMLDILRSPPMGFEDFVKGHFRKYSHAILMNCKLKGKLSESQTRTELFFEMIEAFEANGSYCEHLVHGVQRVTSTNLQQQKINSDGTSMGQLFKRALTKTDNSIMQWRFNFDDGNGTFPYH